VGGFYIYGTDIVNVLVLSVTKAEEKISLNVTTYPVT